MKPFSVFLYLLAASTVSASAAPHSGSSPKIVLDEPTPKLSKLSVDKISAADNVPSNLGGDSGDDKDRASFLMAISMIVVSEIGDKTFLIAALMAMKHLKWVVFSAGYSSLVVMTVLLGIVGHALPTLISQRVTQFLASVLFLVFGFKLTSEGLAMSKEAGVDEELAEVEEELQASNMNVEMDELEGGNGRRLSFSPAKNKPWYKSVGAQLTNLASFVLSPVWIQVFVMTFLGEWGDRSQIATIAMAAGSDYWFVILGAIVGHGLCTAAACIGGQLLATRISMRNVTLGGAAAFFVFSVLYFYDFYTHVPEGQLPQ